ncbi:hypothetical protein GOP47_0024136 [Adiantum capillus-veneris]|uniref:Uncharacterized protein n=1 Tax=Adiantum capillus-veneris TaxID=13818 RepID=A0A9D4Z6L4_ADICA|nr:hypothetical protein GOP47_0024136 [Adiantum capillus-veneris]
MWLAKEQQESQHVTVYHDTFKSSQGSRVEVQMLPKEAQDLAKEDVVKPLWEKIGRKDYMELEPCCNVDYKRAYELLHSITQERRATISDLNDSLIELNITEEQVVIP